MKVSAKATSKYLSKGDIQAPFVAIMDFVRTETLQNPTEQKDVLHFIGDTIKPLVLNVTNKRLIIAAFGDESDDWRGQCIEIYVNHDITNSSGAVVGGVRVRIPAPTGNAPRAGARNGAPPLPAPKPAPAAPKAEPPSLSQSEKHRIVLDGFVKARSEAKVHEFAAWAKNQDFTPDQDDEQSDAFHAALERIALAQASTTPRRQASARG
jgi:hypothetical protein